MKKYWREYWILFQWRNRGLQLINNWHEFKTEEWHLVGLSRKFRNGSYEYYFMLLGFQLRLLKYSK